MRDFPIFQHPLLLSTPVKAAASPHLPVHLLSRTRASFHNIDKIVSAVDSPVSVSFLNKTVTTVLLSFVIIDRDVGFELGRRWVCKIRVSHIHELTTLGHQKKKWRPLSHSCNATVVTVTKHRSMTEKHEVVGIAARRPSVNN